MMRPEWVRAAAKGDKEAFSLLIDSCSQTMYATAMAILKNESDAMDAVGDTVLILWEKLPTLKEPRYFKTWMTRILINSCLSLLRRGKREVPQEEAMLREAGEEADLDTSLDVRSALKALSEDDRLILQLFYFEDLSTRQIARVLNITPQAVRMRLSRGRKRFCAEYTAEVRHEKE